MHRSKFYFYISVFLVIYLSLDYSGAADVEIISVVQSPYQYGSAENCQVKYALLIKSTFLLLGNYFSTTVDTPNFSNNVQNIEFNGPIDLNRQYIQLYYYLKPGNVTVDLTIRNLALPNPTDYTFTLNLNYYCQVYTNDSLNIIGQGNPIYSPVAASVYQSYYLNISKSMVTSKSQPLIQCASRDPNFYCLSVNSIDSTDFISIVIMPIVTSNFSRSSTFKIRLSIPSIGDSSVNNIFKEYELTNVFPTNSKRSTQLVSTKYFPPPNTTLTQKQLNYFSYVEVISTYTNIDSYISGKYDQFNTPVLYYAVLGNNTHTTYKNILVYGSQYSYTEYYCDTNCTSVGQTNYSFIAIPEPTSVFSSIFLSNDSNTNSYFFESSGNFSALSNANQRVNSFSDAISFPFGFISNSNFQFTSVTCRTLVGSFYAFFYNQMLQFQISNDVMSGTKISVTVDNLVMNATSGNSFFLSFRARSEKGILRIFIQPFRVFLDKSNLVSGDSFDGVYESEYSYLRALGYNYGELSLTFYYESNTGFSDKFESYSSYTKDLSVFPTVPRAIFTFGLRNITHFEFLYNNIDMSAGGEFYNVLWIGLDKMDPNTKLAIDFGFYSNIDSMVDDEAFYSQYDPDRNMYKIEFQLRQCFLGSQVYRLFHNKGYFTSFELETAIANSSLIVTSTSYDFLRPSLDAVERIPSSPQSIGWTLTISDYPNGFLNGTIVVFTDIDLEPNNIIVNASNRIAGDQFKGVYQITIPFDSTNCKSQTFMIVDVKLYDQYPVPKFLSLYKDMTAVVDVIGTKYEKNLNYSITCQDLNDNQPPVLETLTFTPSIDVGSNNRYFEAEFTISDDISGVSKRHLPYIFILSESKPALKIQSTIVSYSKSLASYSVKAQLPYGFGYNNLIVSIYGICDNNLNMKGYSTNDLKQAGLPYNINRTQSFVDYFLESCSVISKNGGVLSLYGHNLYPEKGLVYVDYRDGKSWVEHRTKFYTNTMAQINISPFTSDYIRVKIIVDWNNSNILDVYPKVLKANPITPKPTVTIPPTISPTPTPTATPNPNICPGTPACNGQGECLSGGCKCKDPWYGPSCLSKSNPIIIPPPAENPTTEFNVTNSEKPKEYFTSKIDLALVNEVDTNGVVVNSYSFENWTLTSNTQDDIRTTYNYTSNFKGRQTIIRTTIEFFKKEANISFAGGIINIHPYSIKFTIDIDKYDFVDRLHSMELVMGASISSSDSDVCSSTMVGKEANSNVQWIKINVDKNALYGRFLDRAVVDNRNITIKNIIREDKSEITDQSITTKVAIQIPYFEESVVIDPDFSSLVDFNNEGSNLNCKKKTGLSTGVIIAIAVSGSVVVLSILIGAIIYFRNRYLFYRFFKSISKCSCFKRGKKQTINMSKMN